jgi:NAD(P)-dependent dehydrogenase (short-subunit alcohol dehydrogenase family)
MTVPTAEARLFGLEGRTILVIGGGQGMGEASVRLLARLGANVAVLDLERERAERVADDARGLGVKALALAADVTDTLAVVTAVARCESEFGQLDGMAAIVGMAAWSSILDMTDEVWDLDHRRNLRYFFVAAREVGRRIIGRGGSGSIVAVSSVDGIRSAPNHGSYGAAKAGLINLVKTMAVEWGDLGVRVNAIAPGGIVTPRLPLTDPAREREAMAALPMRRRGSIEDIAKAAAYFLSDLSPYVTGQTLAVDGGFEAAGVFGNKSALPTGGTYGMKV